jgi:hypothetical protein
VLILSSEDSSSRTIRPRLEAAGADLDRVHLLCAARNPDYSYGPFSLRQHMRRMEEWLEDSGKVRLVLFDPLAAYAGASRESEVRALLNPFAAFAQRAGVAVIGIVHLNKNVRGKALYRASGSLAFVAAARHVYAVTRDPDDEGLRLLVRIKNNLSQDENGFSFAIERDGAGRPRIAWDSTPLPLDAQAALAGPQSERGARSPAQDWLRQALTGGPMPVRELRKQAAAAGHAWGTVKHAKQRLGALATRSGFGGGGHWSLAPAEEPKAQNGAGRAA